MIDGMIGFAIGFIFGMMALSIWAVIVAGHNNTDGDTTDGKD